MSRRRRFRMNSSSDEEDISVSETLISSNANPNPNSNDPVNTSATSEVIPLEISDEDFADVPEEFSPPRPNRVQNQDQSFQDSVAETIPSLSSSTESSTGTTIGSFLGNLGLKLRTEWLHSCASELNNSIPGYANLNVAEKGRLIFEQFLFSDMNLSGGGLLPENVHTLHLVDLPGPFVLQVDEIVNISCHLRDRYQNVPAGIKRCLKLSMTDGVQRVFGMEYRPINSLQVLVPAGLKVVIRNVNVRRGLLMLVPEVLEVLGGMVEDLEIARRKLVEEVNKPPRGKRTRTGVVPPLASRATIAAWKPDDVDDGANGVGNSAIADNSTLQDAIPSRSSTQGTPYAPSSNNTFIRSRETTEQVSGFPNRASNVEGNPISRTATAPSATNTFGRSRETTQQETGISNRASNVECNTASRVAAGFNEINMVDATAPSATNTFRRSRETAQQEAEISNRTSSVECNTTSRVAAGFNEIDMVDATTPSATNTFRRSRETTHQETEISNRASNVECNRGSRVAAGSNEINMVDATVAMSEIDITEEEFAVPSRRPNIECNPSSNAVPYVGEIAIDNSHRLTGDKEIPFTYLASLLSDWAVKMDGAPFIRGKIKCVMTGVRGFQFKNRTKYELLVYVDDGSLISEVCIDHNVVQTRIGHSPEEVNAALSSPDKNIVGKMRETMMAFQTILSNFEGTLLVEMNKSSTVPVVLEMNEGSSTSDAWWLLRRLDLFTSPQTPQHHQLEPIAISP
ncbi:hypothetical protein C5167_022350 [Papaver somniferum]|uniref:RecQ-mediated genome instability protein 1 n=1 Tax=Papaver somniferum TaxID=3469 RepID=A0A4Y7JHP0_PAPSO|nr:recQ-mediated genome instability protein 1-like [Papaver somniferum]RZC60583.1 hypothetical protein C5167_022350 [Papaver somniferum]